MLSSLDITRILAESSRMLIGSEITGLEYYRKERAFQLYIKEEKHFCLTFSFHPDRSGFYFLPAGKSRLETSEKYRPFARELAGGKITAINQLPNDRMVEVEAVSHNTTYYLLFEVIGPNGNLWLLDAEKKMRGSLRDKKFTPGEVYQPPPLPAKLDPRIFTLDDLRSLFGNHPNVNPARLIEKNIYGFDYPLSQTALAELDKTSPAENDERLQRLLARIQDIVASYDSTEKPIYAYRIKGKTEYYPVKIAGYEPKGKFRTLSEAQRNVITVTKEVDETEAYREKTLKSIASRITKTEKLLNNIGRDIEEAERYDQYRQFADLLKIHLAELKRGMTHITVDNLYESSEPVDIPLDPKLSGIQNIEQYSRKYRKGREGLALLERRREIVSQELHNLKEAARDFEEHFERAEQKYPEFLPRSTARTRVPEASRPLPYKEYLTSTGVTVLVGKSGANNDRTTFEYAKPYDLWFHASQCPGSHVVLKFPHKGFEPSKGEIAEAAALAAWFSKARGSGSVPVSYTEKKYVRKPRKAKPGLVTIEREKTIVVVPQELRRKE